MNHKKVLLRERKRHTARRVASARYADPSRGVPHLRSGGYPVPCLGGLPIPGLGVPHPKSGGAPSQVREVPPGQTWDGVPPSQTWDGVPPSQTWDGVPPGQTWDGVPPGQTWDGVVRKFHVGKLMNHKKVLLCEHKRHTTWHVASARYADPSGGYPISGLGGTPSHVQGSTHPRSRGVTPSQVWRGSTPSQVWGVPYPRSGVPHPRSMGVPHSRSRGVPHPRSGGTPFQVWGVPHPKSGGTPSQVWGYPW